MKDEYVPSEKYRNMFGVERNGYGCQRVDLYLAQLEVAFKKIREDNRSLKRDLAAGMAPAAPQQAQQGFGLFPPESEMAAQLEQQGQYIMQLQAQLAEQQDRNQRISAQMAQMAQMHQQIQQAQPGDPQAAEALMAQIAALRGEADALRQQLRRQAAAPAMGVVQPAPYQISEEEQQQGLIGKVLVEARAQAEAMMSAAKQEADTMTRRARQRVDELRAEQERVQSQLQGISYGLRNILRENAGAEYQQRGEEYAAS